MTIPSQPRTTRPRAMSCCITSRAWLIGIETDQARRELPLIREAHDDVLSVLDHVVVRQDVSFGIHQDAGAGGARVLARPPAKIALVELLTEELLEPLRGFLRRAGRRLLRHRAH